MPKTARFCTAKGVLLAGMAFAAAPAATWAATASEQVIYSFKGVTAQDGESPQQGNLINVAGVFYGTTFNGGGAACHCGTVYSVTPDGDETVLHRFTGFTYGDGQEPLGSLLNVGGTLYGTTIDGGAHGNFDGTIYRILVDGTEQVVHSFGATPTDAKNPYGGLIELNGTLFGTTESGGAHGFGTVYSLTADGVVSILYSFTGSSGDGSYPAGALLAVDGVLYGTTAGGGADSGGTVFSLTMSGHETVLHSFGATGLGDGIAPEAGLIEANGKLFGTTYEGGTNSAGTVFSITTAGTEAVVHSFYPDDGGPLSDLLDVNGTLFGTTAGNYTPGDRGLGTVFAILPSGAQQLVYRFTIASVARYPLSGLIRLGGALYGTTLNGGAADYGAVYSISPP